MKLKVCGISNPIEIETCVSLNVNYCGFILNYPKSHRYISFDKANFKLKLHKNWDISRCWMIVLRIRFSLQSRRENHVFPWYRLSLRNEIMTAMTIISPRFLSCLHSSRFKKKNQWKNLGFVTEVSDCAFFNRFILFRC